MGQIVNSNNSGFTLVEFLVAMVIMMVGLLGLLQTVNYALHYNLENEYRREASLIADEKMTNEKTKTFAQISTVSNVTLTQRKILNGFKNFSVAKRGTTITSNTKQVEYEIRWQHKSKRYSHSIVSLLSQQAE